MERKEHMSDIGPEFHPDPPSSSERPEGTDLESLRRRTEDAEARARLAEETARNATATINLARDQITQLSAQNLELTRRLGESDAEKAELARRMDENAGRVANMEQQLQAEKVAREEEKEETVQHFKDLLATERQRMAAEVAKFGEARRGERFFPEGIDPDNEHHIDTLWEKFEDFLFIEESRGGKFDDNKASTLVRAIQLELSSLPDLQAKMFNMLSARYSYKNLSNLMAIGAVEPYADLVVQMEGIDHQTILSLPGISKTADNSLPGAIEVLDDAAVWRKDGGVTLNHQLAILKSIASDVKEMEGYQRRFGLTLANFNENERVLVLQDADKLLDPEKQKEIDWFKGLDERKRLATIRLLKQVKRNTTLATTAHNLVGSSVRYDGLVYKPEYGGGNVEIRNIFLDIPKDLGGGRINLTDLFLDAVTEDEKTKKKELEDKIALVRKHRGYLIPMAWDRAMRKFYIENWDKIDFNASLGGKAAGIIKSRFHNPVRYEKSDEKYPGEPGTEPLKKATYVGVLPMMFISMRGSVAEQLMEWGGDVKARLETSGRIKGGDKVRKMFNEDGPRLLYNPEAIGGFAQSMKDFMAALAYLPGDEQKEQMAYMIEPIAKFSMDDLRRVFKYENQNAYAVDNGIRLTRERGYINPQQEENLKKEVILRKSIFRKLPILRNIAMELKVAFGGALKSIPALWEMIKLFFKQSFSLK